jgi:hypothetical protein
MLIRVHPCPSVVDPFTDSQSTDCQAGAGGLFCGGQILAAAGCKPAAGISDRLVKQTLENYQAS